MDGTVFNAAQKLQRAIDKTTDEQTLIWAHGFLTGVIKSIENRVPDLMNSNTLIQSLRADLDEMMRKDPRLFAGNGMDDAEDAPVPARNTRGPKGRSGGAAVPLPNPDQPM